MIPDHSSGKSITKIVVTGGPCGGKSTALSWIQNNYTKLGYTVLFIPETATELINAGVLSGCGRDLFQETLMELQLEKERVFDRVLEQTDAERILLVCDRGVVDSRSFMTGEHYHAVLKRLGLTETEARERYDAVFHLVTAAKGAEEFYTCSNNTARQETAAEAALADDRLIAAWAGHPHFHVIDNSGDFHDKMLRLLQGIDSTLGIPVPGEVEKKLLIAYPDVAWLESLPGCRRIEITQTYLLAGEDRELRVRRRGENGGYTWYETEKRRVSATKRVERERRLTEKEYLSSLRYADPAKRTIEKTRYYLTLDNRCYEIDLFPFWQDRALVETQLMSAEEELRLPEGFRVLSDVTEDARYFNAALAEPEGCDIPLP